MAYDGTSYAGFQVQPNARTVQGELERALSGVCDEAVRVTGAGRTDAGVHASGQVIDFRTESALDGVTIGRGVNALLPEDIAVSALEPAAELGRCRAQHLERDVDQQQVVRQDHGAGGGTGQQPGKPGIAAVAAHPLPREHQQRGRDQRDGGGVGRRGAQRGLVGPRRVGSRRWARLRKPRAEPVLSFSLSPHWSQTGF
mgnify:CR=1 FL=1